jgi:hypothetical protein
MQASHPRDRTIIGSLWRIPQGRPQWQNAEELHGNPPTITYPKAVHLKETKTIRLYIMPRSDEGTTTSDYDLLYEDLSTGQFLYDQAASNSTQHAAEHLKLIEQTPHDQEWVFTRINMADPSREGTNLMVCRDSTLNVHQVSLLTSFK